MSRNFEMNCSLDDCIEELSFTLLLELRKDLIIDRFASAFLSCVIFYSFEYFTGGQHSSEF